MAGDVGGGEAYDDDNGGHGVDVDEYHEDKCDDDEDDGCVLILKMNVTTMTFCSS